MGDQITLLDVCKLPDVQIHSKTSLFKHIVSKQNPQMSKIRENIIKLSYTNKVIGVRGEEVGIISKRLPLKFKQYNKNKKQAKYKKLQQKQQILVVSNYVPHQNFYAAPLPTVRKQKIKNQPQQIQNILLSIDAQRNSGITIGQHYRSTTSLKPRTKSMSKFCTISKKQEIKAYQERAKQSKQTKRSNNSQQKYSRQNKRSSVGSKWIGNRKSFSHLLKQVNSQQNLQPLSHEDNTLYRKFQKLNQKARAIKLQQQMNKSYEGRYQQKYQNPTKQLIQ